MLLVNLFAVALMAAQPAPAVGTQATLVAPRAISLTLDGHRWTCEETGVCVGRGGGVSQP